jgi:hypothetical protein
VVHHGVKKPAQNPDPQLEERQSRERFVIAFRRPSDNQQIRCCFATSFQIVPIDNELVTRQEKSFVVVLNLLETSKTVKTGTNMLSVPDTFAAFPFCSVSAAAQTKPNMALTQLGRNAVMHLL